MADTVSEVKVIKHAFKQGNPRAAWSRVLIEPNPEAKI